MAQRRRSRLRRWAPAFVAIVAAHLTAFVVLERDAIRQDINLAVYDEPQTPIELQAPPARPKSPSKPAAAHRLHISPLRAPRVVAEADLPSAQVTGPGTPGDGSAFAPGDLVGAGDLPDFSTPPTIDAPSAQYPINPGEWDVSEHWLVLSRLEKYCIQPDNILRFMVAPCNHIYHCAYSVEDVADGKLRFVGVIRGKDQLYNVHGSGAYTPTQLKVNITGAGHYKILPLAFAASLEGHFVSAQCSADDKPLRQR